MSTSPEFQAAARAALEPWSSSDQKIGALAYMESLATPESLKILRQAMELTGLYVSADSRNNPNLPLSGEIAGAAARGIGRLDTLGGIDLLLSLLLSDHESKILRECAAFGLGGLITKEVFQAYEKAIQVSDSIVFERVLRSIDESFLFLGKQSLPCADDFLVFLFNGAVECLNNSGQLDCKGVYGIIARYINNKAESDIINFLSGNTHAPEWRVAINVLLLRDSKEARVALAVALMKTGLPAEIYKEIGVQLKASQEKTIRTKANRAIRDYPSWRKVFKLFLTGEKERRGAQIEAANLILSSRG